MQKHWESQARVKSRSEGELVCAPGLTLRATFFVARDDRDGCSRYRALRDLIRQMN